MLKYGKIHPKQTNELRKVYKWGNEIKHTRTKHNIDFCKQEKFLKYILVQFYTTRLVGSRVPTFEVEHFNYRLCP